MQNNLSPSKLLGRVAAVAQRHPRLLKRLGDLETRAVEHRLAGIAVNAPIYITGLARAGSTIMLELLSRHPDTATHRYVDFPLLHVPVWWHGFVARAARSDTDAVERFHGDRIRVTAQSPEAMEEILWMAFFPRCHEPSEVNVMDAGTEAPAFESFYRDHIRKLLFIRKGSRYLAKGNYNAVRLRYLHKLFPDARFVLMVRPPVGHVASLMKQHRLLCEEERRDPRVLTYMRQSGHFEFGLDRRPVNTGEPGRIERVRGLWESGDEARGWACYWSVVYDYLSDVLDQDAGLRAACTLVDYRRLCEHSETVLNRVYARTGLEVGADTVAEQAEILTPPDYYSPGLTGAEERAIEDEALGTYERILRFA
jgi:hypothetical protein